VTGVPTCALPTCALQRDLEPRAPGGPGRLPLPVVVDAVDAAVVELVEDRERELDVVVAQEPPGRGVERTRRGVVDGPQGRCRVGAGGLGERGQEGGAQRAARLRQGQPPGAEGRDDGGRLAGRGDAVGRGTRGVGGDGGGGHHGLLALARTAPLPAPPSCSPRTARLASRTAARRAVRGGISPARSPAGTSRTYRAA